MLSPYKEARSLYEDVNDFYSVLDYCGEHGVIINNHEVFVCGYKTYSNSIAPTICHLNALTKERSSLSAS